MADARTTTEPLAANPLTAGVEAGLLPAPCTVVIFGGGGDLARRKLLPALYNTSLDGLLPGCAIVGFSLGEMTGEAYRKFAREGAERFSRRPVEEAAWTDFERLFDYVTGSCTDPSAYARLRAKLESIEQAHGLPGNRIFYLSIPPSLIGTCAEQLKAAGLVSAGEGRLTVKSEATAGGVRSLAIPVGSRAGMVARQLSDLAPDPLFHATLGVACGMAAGLHQ